jgi:hypothetical protein
MKKFLPGDTITVPVPMHRTLRDGTLGNIIRQSGLPKYLFESEELTIVSQESPD